jgi:DNA replication protein DnaC
VDNIKPLNKISTAIFSNLKIIGQRTCEHCGASVNIIETDKGQVSDCLNCENLAIQKEHEAYIQEMDAKKNEIIYNRFSIVPDDLEGASFDNYNPNHPTQEEALKKAVWYAQQFGNTEGFNSLIFKGDYGIGKSHLTKAIADVVKEKGYTVIYIDIPSLMKKIRNTYGNKAVSEEEIYQAIDKADLVVFDDLGAERVKKDDDGSSWVGEVLFQMFTSRTSKPKLITTNCGSDELRKKYGANGGRIVSRMMKGTRAVKMEGKDMRIDEF